MFPGPLVKTAEDLRKKLLEEKKIRIFHDTDPDGIFSAAILEDFLEKRGLEVEACGTGREGVEFGGAVVLLDIAYKYGKQPGTIYYIDHHEPERLPLPDNVYSLNPWLLNLKNPFRWNTSLLAWLVAGQEETYEWMAAAGHWADHCINEFTKNWVGKIINKYGDSIAAAAKYVGLAKYFEDISPDSMRELVRSASSPEEIVSHPKLRNLNKIMENEIKYYLSILGSERGPVVVYIVETTIKKLKSPLSTIISDRYPDTIYVICQRDDKYLDCSLRFQNAVQHGIHLGNVAKDAARLFGGSGGGHPPAAAVKIPLLHEKEFIKWIRERLEMMYK